MPVLTQQDITVVRRVLTGELSLNDLARTCSPAQRAATVVTILVAGGKTRFGSTEKGLYGRYMHMIGVGDMTPQERELYEEDWLAPALKWRDANLIDFARRLGLHRSDRAGNHTVLQLPQALWELLSDVELCKKAQAIFTAASHSIRDDEMAKRELEVHLQALVEAIHRDSVIPPVLRQWVLRSRVLQVYDALDTVVRDCAADTDTTKVGRLLLTAIHDPDNYGCLDPSLITTPDEAHRVYLAFKRLVEWYIPARFLK